MLETNTIVEYVTTVTGHIRALAEEKPLSRSRLPRLQAYADHEWEQLVRSHPGPWLLAEGCAVLGLTVSTCQGMPIFQWRCAFMPRPRHAGPESHILPLGFLFYYDLYAVYPSSGVAHVAARHGSGNKVAHGSCDPEASLPDTEHRPALEEALRRARKANAFWTSDLPVCRYFEDALPKPRSRALRTNQSSPHTVTIPTAWAEGLSSLLSP